MKIEELTLEKFFETAKLMKQLRLPWIIVEMAKELGVKRTELMKFVNDHPKNINTKYYKIKNKEILLINGIYLAAEDNPLTDEYAEVRRKEHWIRVGKVDDYGYVIGFYLLPYNEAKTWDSCKKWENQEEDVKKFREIPEVKEEIDFPKGSFGDGWTDTRKCGFRRSDGQAVVKQAFDKGLRIYVDGYGAIDTPEEIEEVGKRS